MPSVSLAPVLRQRFFDSNGNPLAGGKVFSYQAGTSTPQATYTDNTGTTPNANPVILDADGEADIWLDQTLSYKFILQDSLGVQQWVTDGVIGILTANSVTTLSIVDGAVTTEKLADNSVTLAKMADNSVGTAELIDGSVTRAKTEANFFIPPAFTKILTGSGTFFSSYLFKITSGSAIVGATYTNNGFTFTVANTIVSSPYLVCTSSTGVPTASGTLTYASGTGDATITFSSVELPMYSKIKLAGAGGGGAGSGTSASGGTGGTGGNTTFGTAFIVANGGVGAVASAGGAGGSITFSTAVGFFLSGGGGGSSGTTATSNTIMPGGIGGSNPFGGAGVGGSGNAVTNSGGGGGGANSPNTSSTASGGGGGGSGGYGEFMIIDPAVSYAYAIGAAGAAGTAGTSGAAGGAGATGQIIIMEYWE